MLHVTSVIFCRFTMNLNRGDTIQSEVKMRDDLLDTPLTETDGLSIEDRLQRLEFALDAGMQQTTQVAELVASAFEQLDEIKQELTTAVKSSSDLLQRIHELEERTDRAVL